MNNSNKLEAAIGRLQAYRARRPNSRWVVLSASKTLIVFAPWWVRLAMRLGTPGIAHRVITGEPCILWEWEVPNE